MSPTSYIENGEADVNNGGDNHDGICDGPLPWPDKDAKEEEAKGEL